MRELAGYVVEHHMRRDDSPMRGKVYEFYDPATRQQGYGAGWDTMHDGAFFANACILAYRATRDEFYFKGKYDHPPGGWSEPPAAEVTATLRRELDEGLRYWQKEWQTRGYIRPHWPIGGKFPTKHYWQHRVSETGGYAHLIAACAVSLMSLDGKNDWDLAWSVVTGPLAARAAR